MHKESRYHMKGMGSLLSMYGGAGDEVESQYQEKKEMFLKAKNEYDNETDKDKREEYRKTMENSKK